MFTESTVINRELSGHTDHMTVQHMNGGYRLIIASNRDEYYNRSTLPANYWVEDQNIIGGRDLELSNVGGTWLALNNHGKFAVLLNVFQKNNRPNAITRGQLVENYVKGNTTATEYMVNLQDVYNGFKLITITISKQFLDIHFFTNCVQDDDQAMEYLPNGVHGFASGPFLKVIEGKKRFNDIVKKYGHSDTKDTLIDELLGLLKWNKQHYPDKVLIDQTPKHLGTDYQKQYSSVFVEMPTLQYGTRTHTIILLDHDGKIEYNEWTKFNSNWELRRFNTTLKCET